MKRNLLMTLAACSVLGLAAAGTAPQRYPASGNVLLEAFVPENDGAGWGMRSNGDVLYFAGGAFHAVTGRYPVVVNNDFRRFSGDASRGYYLQCLDGWKNTKFLCRLSDGQVRLHTKPLAVAKHSDELLGNTYIAQDGRVVSWNTERIMLWQHDEWSPLPALIAHDEGLPVIFEHDGRIIIVCGLLFHVLAPDGKLTTYRPGWKDPTYSCVHWQGAVAVRTARGSAVPEAFDLLSGQPLPLPQPFSEVREPVTKLLVALNGTVWTKTGRALYRLVPDGEASRIARPSEGVMDIVAIVDGTRSAVPLEQDQGWNVFFSDGNPSLSRWNASGVERWDARQGVAINIRNFSYTADRTFWFLAGGENARLFRVPLDGAPPETPDDQTDRWQTFKIRNGTRLMEMGGTLAFFPETGLLLKRWDGAVFTEQFLSQELMDGVHNGVAWDNQGYVYRQHSSSTAPFDCLTEIGTNAVTVVSDAFTDDPQGKMASALVRAVKRGATAFNQQGWEIALTPDKKIWLLDLNEEVIRYYDGAAWRRVRFDGVAVALTYSPRDGIVLRTRDNRTFVYVEGLFEERATIESCLPPAAVLTSADLDGTPLDQGIISARYLDRKGNLWFRLGLEATVVCLHVADLRVTAQGETDPRHPDQLAIRAAVEPPLKGVRYVARLDGEQAWQPLQTPAGAPARLRFPHSGTYTCEVAAVVLGEQLPQTARVTHTARVTLPDTRLALPQDAGEVLPVTHYVWRPPVTTVPTCFTRGTTCELLWRKAESAEPWRPLDTGGRFPLRLLGTNGVYRLEFAAREEGFWRDDSPVRLTVRLALDDEGQLLVTLDHLASEDPYLRDGAMRRLEEQRQRWQPLLQRLEKQASEARARLQALEPALQMLRQEAEGIPLNNR